MKSPCVSKLIISGEYFYIILIDGSSLLKMVTFPDDISEPLLENKSLSIIADPDFYHHSESEPRTRVGSHPWIALTELEDLWYDARARFHGRF